jgi:hypothetical protein
VATLAALAALAPAVFALRPVCVWYPQATQSTAPADIEAPQLGQARDRSSADARSASSRAPLASALASSSNSDDSAGFGALGVLPWDAVGGGGWAAATKTALHFGHRTFRPAADSPTFNRAPHGHCTTM